jgi:hypothetical protein
LRSLAPVCRDRATFVCPEVDPASPLQFVINAAAGSGDADTKREVIETAVRAAGATLARAQRQPARA